MDNYKLPDNWKKNGWKKLLGKQYQYYGQFTGKGFKQYYNPKDTSVPWDN